MLGSLLLVGCTSSNKEDIDLVIPVNSKPVDIFNPYISKSAIKDSKVVEKIAIEDKHDRQNIIEDSDYVGYNSPKGTYFTNVTESKNTTSIKPKVKEKIL